jgi:hypothetical protein
MDAPGTVISIVTRAEMFVVEKLSKVGQGAGGQLQEDQ